MSGRWADHAVGRLGGWRRVRRGLAAIGLVLLAFVVFGVIPYNLHPNDSHAYWAVDPSDPYRGAQLGAPDAFFYAPVVAQLLGPLTALPFDAFRVLWGALALGALAGAGALWTLIMPGVTEDLVRGNIHILLAVAILAGFRVPGAWAAVLLTKVTPGIGLLWFAIRREWRSLAQVAVVTALIVVASVVVGGVQLWIDWVRLLATSAESPRTYTYLGVAPPPLVVRMLLAVAVVTWGAWTNRRWTVPISAFLALPVIWPSGFALLAAAPPLWLADRQPARTDRSTQVKPAPEAA